VLPPVVEVVPAGAVLADVRWYLDGSSGRDAYEDGHLPGAVFVDLDAWLADRGSPALGRHPLPTPERFAKGMALLGIGDDTTVVGYDDAGGVIAARLVWMLRATGHDAALLDGGLTAYEGERETEAVARPPALFTARPWPGDQLADLRDAVEGKHVIDARPGPRFRGEGDLSQEVDPRAGHIPGAQSLPCRDNLGGDGRFLPVDELRARVAAVGISPGDDVVSYCGSGVTACHNLLVLEHAGFGRGRLYPGSWSQYSHTDLPAETSTLQ
jgi:thiosulfate/3-mercaptopyruvate sulfurtransferase